MKLNSLLASIGSGLLLVLFISPGVFFPSLGARFFTSHAQERQTQKFFVFDGHSHPTSTAYRRGSNIGDPNFSPACHLL